LRVERLPCEREPGREPAHDRGARAAGARAQRDAVDEREAQPVARQPARAPERLHDEVRRVGRQGLGALALDSHLERAVVALDEGFVAQWQRDAEAVVARAEVGRRGGDRDVHALHRRSMAAGDRAPYDRRAPTKATSLPRRLDVRRTIAVTVNGTTIERD